MKQRACPVPRLDFATDSGGSLTHLPCQVPSNPTPLLPNQDTSAIAQFDRFPLLLPRG
ncbi:hypothetical protein LZ32DRAFT_178028 [Colletotrichum eremochloae]|nr:hypothetical protein LZ32DRAFT_178028 [Colletotrichum eremochloae]